MLDDDEPTTFETNPLGNRQRLVPRASFLARQRPIEVIEEATAAVRSSMILDEHTHDEALLSGEHTIGDLALPAASAVMLPALALAPPVPTLPQAAALMLLPKEIHYGAAAMHYPPVAKPYNPATETHTALPIASRRVRYIAVPAILSLALIVLGGAVVPADIEAHAPMANATTAEEPAGTPRSSTSAHEPEAPPEVIEAKPTRIVFAPRPRAAIAPFAKRAGKHRPVKVDASSALGQLRPRKAW
jgi:hypothetical protein